jgi:hypothetical protein
MRTITLTDSQFTTLLDGLSMSFPEALALREYIRENATETPDDPPADPVSDSVTLGLAKMREFVLAWDSYTPPPGQEHYHAEGFRRAALEITRATKTVLWTAYHGAIPATLDAEARGTFAALRARYDSALAMLAATTPGGTP